MDWFHKRQIKTVVISSSDLGQPGVLRAFLSQLNGPRLAIDIPKQGGKDLVFTGTGDLFASLFLAHSHACEDVSDVFEKTIASLQAVIKRTVASLPHNDGPVKACERELKLVQSKAEIEKPHVLLRAQRLKLDHEIAHAGPDWHLDSSEEPRDCHMPRSQSRLIPFVLPPAVQTGILTAPKNHETVTCHGPSHGSYPSSCHQQVGGYKSARRTPGKQA
ncbi:GL27371, isoform B [Drosophila persimilis]|uniref:pyridoxal kinase n=1 Tax=Drosophila persimilis TaxID=7234 RepID=B4H1N4_DROPE|nr:GL27371, isoform B [Drosophila persimilis]